MMFVHYVARHCLAKGSKTSQSIVNKSRIFVVYLWVRLCQVKNFLYIYEFALVWQVKFRDWPAKSFAFFTKCLLLCITRILLICLRGCFLLLLNMLRGFLSSRVFIKILFQELAEYMGLPKLNERLKDP